MSAGGPGPTTPDFNHPVLLHLSKWKNGSLHFGWLSRSYHRPLLLHQPSDTEDTATSKRRPLPSPLPVTPPLPPPISQILSRFVLPQPSNLQIRRELVYVEDVVRHFEREDDRARGQWPEGHIASAVCRVSRQEMAEVVEDARVVAQRLEAWPLDGLGLLLLGGMLLKLIR